MARPEWFVCLRGPDLTGACRVSRKELIDEVLSLPVEERAAIVDSILRSLNAPHAETDLAWIAVAKRRLDELTSGTVKPIPAEDVFAQIRDRHPR
jgi:putative addiction module component (TIGR02574 family)